MFDNLWPETKIKTQKERYRNCTYMGNKPDVHLRSR